MFWLNDTRKTDIFKERQLLAVDVLIPCSMPNLQEKECKIPPQIPL